MHHLRNQSLTRDYTSDEALKDIPLLKSHSTNNSRKYSKNDLVADWNDMFDKELLLDVPPPPSPLHLSSSVPLESPVPRLSITCNKGAMGAEAPTESDVRQIICNTETINRATRKTLKRKMIQTKMDAAIKKIKISKFDLSDKCLQRKQKYSKRVKNWLADMNATRSREVEAGEAGEVVGGGARAWATRVGQKNKAAKVIQSHLTNCEGVIKFGKAKL